MSTKNNDQAVAIIRWLCEKYPESFRMGSGAALPLKLDIAADILHRTPLQPAQQKVLRHAISLYQQRPDYQGRLALGRWRRNLWGQKAGPVFSAEREQARQWMLERGHWTEQMELQYQNNEAPKDDAC